MNKCQLIGNLTRDPELRSTQGGKSVVNFGIAINKFFKKGGEKAKETIFLDCEAWDTGAEMIEKYFKKGDAIVVSNGELKQDEWTDKQGQKRSKIAVCVREFEFPPGGNKSRKRDEDEGAGETAPAAEDNGQRAADDSEIPF